MTERVPYWTEKSDAKKVMQEILGKMKRKRSMKSALPVICESMVTGGRSFAPSDYRKFTHEVGPVHWQGIIYQSRNTMMGTIFSYYKHKAMIIRGYPKIKYSEDSRVLNQPCYAENKLDGTNLGIWMFPDGEIMGKTRHVEFWDNQGYKGRNWKLLWMKTGLYDKALPLLKDDYMIFGELYGQENPGEFVRYSIPIDFKVFDIVDMRDFGFVSLEKKVNLCSKYGLPHIGTHWQGILTVKEVERIELEAAQYVKEDGYEGFVAKFYDPILEDTHFCKLKCKEIHEKAWALSPRSGVPRALIAKGIRKGFDAGIRDMDALLEFVKEELMEEADPDIVIKATEDIKRMVYKIVQPIEGAEMVFEYLKELEGQGIEVSEKNKAKVMSMLGTKFFGQNPGRLYNAFMTYLVKGEKE